MVPEDEKTERGIIMGEILRNNLTDIGTQRIILD